MRGFRPASPWPVRQSIPFPRDVKDAMFLACAVASDADYFITGDRDFTEARKLVNTRIVSVNQFEALVRQRAQRD